MGIVFFFLHWNHQTKDLVKIQWENCYTILFQNIKYDLGVKHLIISKYLNKKKMSYQTLY